MSAEMFLPCRPSIIATRPVPNGVEVVIHDYQGFCIELEYSDVLEGEYGPRRGVPVRSPGQAIVPVQPGASVLIWASVVSHSGVRSGWSGPVSYERPVESPGQARASRLDERVRHFKGVLEKVSYPDWDFIVSTSGEAIYLQIRATDKCNVTGEPMIWRSGKWLLSEHMLDEEVVQKALKAVLTALEHEAREKFLYRGRAIFGPHYCLDMLWEICGRPGAVVERSLPGVLPVAPGPEVVGHTGLTTGVPMWPDRDFARSLNAQDLRALEARMAKRVRSTDNPETVTHSSLWHIRDEIMHRGGQPAFDTNGNPVKHLFR